jgi:hypothetical protein
MAGARAIVVRPRESVMPIDPPRGDPPIPDGTPADVHITWEARRPVTDPTLGIAVASPPPARTAANRLVTIGDSLTHGFQSLAISKTRLSWPALVANQLGCEFRFPTYDGYGGLPFNLELTIRQLGDEFGHLSVLEYAPALVWLLHWAHQIEHWWATGADAAWKPPPGLNHNLAVYSYDINDACTRTLGEIDDSIVAPSFEWLRMQIDNDVDRAARRVLANASPAMTLLDAAAHHAETGIENLVVALGANNVLGVVIDLKYRWAQGEASRGSGSAWSPTFFDHDWQALVARLEAIDAQRVLVATVPHVTVVPLFKAVGDRLRDDSRYFQRYTHAWLAADFDPRHDPYLTGDQARAIDSAIDQYNETIVATVRQARQQGRDWYVLELAGILDRLAHRRYLEHPEARPSWWDAVGGAYPLPAALDALDPRPDTQFFLSDDTGRTQGGLIALDGVHPTTIGYGLVAQAVLDILHTAGASIANGPAIDFAALLAADTLMGQPPPTLLQDMKLLGWINDKINIAARLLGKRGV